MRSPGASLSKWRRVTRTPIFDLRRGDHEDNRTSPHGTKVRTLLLTAALEFNYLKASIGFLSLIVGPALFVGIMPSLIVYSSHRKLGMAAAHSRIVGPFILVLLAGLAFRVGRPVAAKAIESF